MTGNGDGTLQAPQTFAVGTNPQAVAIGDVDTGGVSIVDVVTVNQGSRDPPRH